jgi:hypothetical protein
MSTRATVTIKSDDDRQKIATWAKNVGPGTVVTFRKKSRSSEQNAKLWSMLHEVAEQVIWYGEKLDADDWKDVFTASLRHARVVPGIDKGTYVPLGMRTSTMTIEEMSNLIELIFAFGAQHDVTFKNTDNETRNSGAGASSQDTPEHAGNHSTPAGAEVTRSQQASVPTDKEKAALSECAQKMLAISRDKKLDMTGKRAVLETTKNSWKSDLPEHLHAKLKTIVATVDKVIKGGQETISAANYLAGIIGCSADTLKP